MPAPVRVKIAFSDNWNATAPSFTELTASDAYSVQAVSIDRGRQYEFDRTQTGTATIELVDTSGDLDPTNATGPFWGLMNPLKQATIELYDPVDAAYSTIFTGFTSRYEVEMHPTEKLFNVRIDLVDGLAVAAAAELVPNGSFGSAVSGNIVYDADTSTSAVKNRIDDVLSEIGWPTASSWRQVFSGNVKLQETVYAPRTSALNVIQDAADAEFPGVSNVYINTAGEFTFHGRFARFDPVNVSSTTDWDFTQWKLGDDAACAADSSTVRVSPPLVMYRDDSNLYTAAIATDKTIDDADIDGQYLEDSTGLAAYGYRTWSAEGLLNAGGSTTTALAECLMMADYYRDNFSTPRTRVGALTVKSQKPTGAYGAANWEFLCNVDISDQAVLTTTHQGGGGFTNSTFYVEGLSYEIFPADASYADVTLTVDVSPASYFDSNPGW